MGYDISVYREKTVFEKEQVNNLVEINSANITFNVSPMFRKAFKSENGLYVLDELDLDSALEEVLAAIKSMLSERKEYEKLNPPNGWGSYESTLLFLFQLCLNFTEVEGGVVFVW